MITYSELNKATNGGIPQSAKAKADAFLEKINVFREKYGKPMVANSYLRTPDRQIAIYKNKAANKQFPFTNGKFVLSKVPMGSKHLTGEACDFQDPDKSIANWVKANLEWVRKEGFYFENFGSTPTWAHIQIVPPKSGKTIFNP